MIRLECLYGWKGLGSRGNWLRVKRTRGIGASNWMGANDIGIETHHLRPGCAAVKTYLFDKGVAPSVSSCNFVGRTARLNSFHFAVMSTVLCSPPFYHKTDNMIKTLTEEHQAIIN